MIHNMAYMWIAGMAVCTVIIIYTDCSWFWIPDWCVAAAALGNGTAWHNGWARPDTACSLSVIILFLVLYLIFPEGLGSGDVKLALALTFGCSGYTAYVMVGAAFLSAAAVGIWVWILMGKKEIPFGPFLLAGWWISLFFGEEIITWVL